MKKYTSFILFIVMTLLLVFSWSSVLSYNDKIEAEVQLHLDNAEKLEKKEVYIDAVSEYESVLRLRPSDYEIAMKIVELYDKLDNTKSYITALENAIACSKDQWEPYKMLSDYYIESAEYSHAYSVLRDAQDNIGDNDEIKKRLITVMKQYTTVPIKYESVQAFHYLDKKSTVGYAKISLNGKYGILSTTNTVVYPCEYDDIGFISENLIPIYINNEYYYLDGNGNRKLVPDEKADFMGTFQNGYAPASFNGVYGYIDKILDQYNFEYSYAGPFSNEIAAVQKNGKWAVINSTLEYVTDFEFDDVLLDEYGFCTENGLFFAKKNNRYFLYNKEGKCLSEGFEDAKMFVSDEAAAIKLNGKWGYVSADGEITIQPKYDDACSFNVGYAPYKSGSKWGCMNLNGDVLIEPCFDRLDSFAKNGFAYAEQDGEKKFIVVTIYE